MKKPENQLMIIFGASGDLTTRKLIPALYDLHDQGLLPTSFAVLGVGRTKLTDKAFRDKMRKGIEEHANKKSLIHKNIDPFLSDLYYLSIDTSLDSDYSKLRKKLDQLNKQYKTGGKHIYYLSTPPSLYGIIPHNLSLHGLNLGKQKDWKRLIVEKPFGVDLESAKKLNRDLLQYFEEDQIYRIDHFLGKETVQNLLVTRFSNGIFEPLWNRNYIHHVEITAAESLGVESRGGYYDQSGAMRDMVQNHLFQLMGLVAMEPPSVIEATAIRNEVMKVFQSLRPIQAEDIDRHIIRGQYTGSKVLGECVPSYRAESGVEPTSRTETYVAMRCMIDNWRWAGVPFYIRTGKRLPTRVTEIVIHFNSTPHHLFGKEEGHGSYHNQLVIRIQPDEGILLKMGMKIPGAGFRVQEINMDFHYKDLNNTYLPSAYERLLLDAMLGDATLYSRGDALEAAWHHVQPVLDAWNNHPDLKVYGYPAGSWGPEIADDLIEGDGLTWRYPCKNLADDGLYCEL